MAFLAPLAVLVAEAPAVAAAVGVAATSVGAALGYFLTLQPAHSPTAAEQQDYPKPEFLQDLTEGTINVAVVGFTGVGKSSFVNALREMKQRHSQAAPTTVTGQGTKEPMAYLYPTQPTMRLNCSDSSSLLEGGREVGVQGENNKIFMLKRRIMVGGKWRAVELSTRQVCTLQKEQIEYVLAEIVIWDLPGVGDSDFPGNTYIKNMGLRFFDVVIVVVGPRVVPDEERIIQELNRFNVAFLVVRTKIDSDVERARQEADDDDTENAVQTALHTIRVDTAATWKVAKAYLVSNLPRLWGQWDFPALRSDIATMIRSRRTLTSGSGSRQ